MSLSKISCFLPSNVVSLLLTQPVKQWIHILSKCKTGNEYLAHLFRAIVKIPKWCEDKTLKDLGKALDKVFDDKKDSHTLTKTAKKIFKEAHKIFKKEKVGKKEHKKRSTQPKATSPAPAEDNSPTRGIPNIGNFCYMATVLQHLRHTNQFESILTGPIHDFATDAERLHLVELQNALQVVVADLRNPQVARVAKEKLVLLVKKMEESGIISQAGDQYDGTEVLTRLLSRLGATPAAVQIDQHILYSDGSREHRNQVEMSHYFPLQTTQEGQTTTQLLTAYFAQTAGCTVRFDVTAQGRVIAQLDGGTGRVAARRALGSDAAEVALLAEQIAYIQEQYKAAHGDVQVNIVPVRYTQNQIASLPGTIQIRINPIGGKALPEERISLVPYLRNPLAVGESAAYELDAVMCRSGVLSDPTSKNPGKRDAGGHFWYYKKENGIWNRYDDLSVTQPTAAEVAQELRESGYASFYNKV